MTQKGTPFRSAVIWAFLMNWGLRGFSSFFVFLLAYFLGPSDFGVMGLAMAYIVLVQMLQDQGLTSAVIQRRDLKPEHLDAVFWFTMTLSLLLAAASWVVAPIWASFYDVPALTPVVRSLALVLPLSGLSIVQQADLRRRLEFRTLAIRSNVSVVAGGVVGVIAAWRGAGVWSLVAQTLTAALVSTALLWGLGTFRPSLRFSWARFREIGRFSGFVFVDALGNYVNRQADTITMGAFFGPLAVGVYQLGSKVRDLVLTTMGRSLSSVSLPEFARLQHDPERLSARYLHFVHMAAVTTVPPLLLLASVSAPIVRLLGHRWHEHAWAASMAIALLALQALPAPLSLFTGALLQARGRPGASAALSWTASGLSVIGYVIAGVFLRNDTIDRQVMGMVLSRLVVVIVVSVPAQITLARRVAGVRMADLVRVSGPAHLAGVLGVGAVMAARTWTSLDAQRALIELAACGAIFATVCGPTLFITDELVRRHGWRLLARRLPGALGLQTGTGSR